MVYLPDGGQLVALLVAPTIAGFFCGLTGSGSAILVQIAFRLFPLLGMDIGEGDASVASRRILAIASVLSLSQYPFSAWQLYRAPQRHIRWDLVAFIFPGLNIVVWVGTWIAMHFKPQFLVLSLGIVFVLVALWQFFHQSIMGRKHDDDKVRKNTRIHLNKKLSRQNLTIDSVSIGPHSSSHQNDCKTGTAGTNLDDLGTLGEFEPSLPKRLTVPDPSFDLQKYGNKTGLDFTLKQPSPMNSNTNSTKTKSDVYSLSINDGSSDAVTISDSSGDQIDEFEMITGPQEHHVDNRPWHQQALDKLTSFEGVLGLICGLVAGLLGGLFGTNGPPIFVYFAYLKLSGAQIRDTCIAVFTTNLFCLLLSRIIFDVFQLEEVLIYVIAVCMSTAGLFVGWYFHPYCDTRTITSLLQFIILLASIPLTEPGTNEPINIVFLVLYLVIALALCAFMVWRISRNNIIKQQAKQQFYTLNGLPSPK